jgi:hypothetical protein
MCIKLGMSKKTQSRKDAENLLKRLENRPDLLERFSSILDLAEDDEERAFDEVESLLIEEVRKLGNETMGSWVSRREEQVAQKLKSESKVQQREKKR